MTKGQPAVGERPTDGADAVIAVLKRLEPELRGIGVDHLSLFGSVARGENGGSSDVDVAVALAPASGMDLVELVALEQRLSQALGRSVDLLTVPIRNPRLRANVERDQRRVF